MGKAVLRRVCNIKEINSIVIAAIIVGGLGTSWAYFEGIGNKVEAAESAQAAICKEVEKNKADIEKNKESVDCDMADIKTTMATMQGTLTQVQVDVGKLQSDSAASKELLNKIWDKLDEKDD